MAVGGRHGVCGLDEDQADTSRIGLTLWLKLGQICVVTRAH